MTFADPRWLYIAPIITVCFGLMVAYGFRRRDALLGRFAAARLLDRLTERASTSRTWIKAGCLTVGVLLIGLALARPQLGVEWSERKARGLDIVFALDSSKSMLATDLRPTRLERAKLAVIDLIERLESDRIGLVAFAGQAFLQTPPTLDYSAFRESLDAVDPTIMTSGGSDIGIALKEAAEAFPSENNVKVVVLLTDGEDLSGKVAEAAETAREAGIRVFAIGIGTPEGEYLRIRNAEGTEEFVRDNNGQPVRSQLDEATLQQIAQATGGQYSRLAGDALDRLYNSVIATLPREERESEMQEIRIERFQWLLAAAFLFLVLEVIIRRRRNIRIQASALACTLLFASPSDMDAQEKTIIEGAVDARSTFNEAYASISTGEFEGAAQLYENAIGLSTDLELQENALYNMAHAHYQTGLTTYNSGDPQTALEQVKKSEALFQSAKEMDPTDSSIDEDIERITHVREAIEKLLDQQNPEQEDSEENQENSEENEESEDGEEGENSEDSQEGEDGDESESSEENSDESESGEQGEESDQNQEGENSEENQGENESSGEDGEPSEENEGDPSQEGTQESTQDPVDDIPQDNANPEEGDEADGEEETGQSTSTPEPTEGEEAEGSASSATLGEAIEGMNPEEAAALLNMLRNNETLLPFIDQKRSGPSGEVRDW